MNTSNVSNIGTIGGVDFAKLRNVFGAFNAIPGFWSLIGPVYAHYLDGATEDEAVQQTLKSVQSLLTNMQQGLGNITTSAAA